MSLIENQGQRDRRSALDAFFGRPPLQGPQRPEPPRAIKERPAEEARRRFREKFFEPKSSHPTSLGKATDFYKATGPEPIKVVPTNGGKTINERRFDGVLIIQDCEGTELLRIPSLDIDGEETIQTGCNGGSSYPA